MQIIKDQHIIDNDWTYIADEAELPVQSINITVSLKRWNSEQDKLQKYAGVGIRINPEDSIESINFSLKDIPLIEIYFPVFTDGRGFSHAQKLRTQLNFQGEIRAVGQFMADQVFYLSRVGVNAFALEDQSHIQDAIASMDDFSASYQASVN